MLTQITITDGENAIRFLQSELYEIFDSIYILSARFDANNLETITFCGKSPERIEAIYLDGKCELKNLSPKEKRIITLSEEDYKKYRKAYKNYLKIQRKIDIESNKKPIHSIYN